MKRLGLRKLAGLGLVLALGAPGGGCIIGTWPTPEERPDPPGLGREPVGPESCGDEVDNDGDGSVDEGCSCGTAVARGCVGVHEGACAFGVQYCVDNVWRECDDFSPGYAPAQAPQLQVVSVSPELLERDTTPAAVVVVEATAPCPGFRLEVGVSLRSSQPVMRVFAPAQDDGSGEDAQAGDGRYTSVVTLPFGPGVEAQTLTVEAETYVHSNKLTATGSVELVTP